ncbi:hypothetical protein GCM10008949_52200 [Deinococcus humi]|nr:hypothetical protein GCM10008949_52200 [Deinococcus humi]
MVRTHLIHGGNIFFSCEIWLARKDIPFDRLYVRAGAVPKIIAHDARIYVQDTVLPELISWVEQQLTQAGRPLTTEMLRRLPSEMRDTPQLYFRRDLPAVLARR